MHWHWHCIDCIVIVLALLGEGSIKSWSRVATLGRRGELPAELGVFFREPLQLRGRILRQLEEEEIGLAACKTLASKLEGDPTT